MSVAVTALSQPSAVLDDLEARAVKALNEIPRAESWSQAQKNGGNLRARLEQAIGFQSVSGAREVTVFVHAPKYAAGRVPGVILVRPHGRDDASASLPTALAALGLLAVEVDVQTHHSALDQLADGITPQALIQQDVRSVLA